MEAENFGARMQRLKRERGMPIAGPGRTRIADKHRPFVGRAERTFALALPAEAERYIDELAPKEPECCPFDHVVLTCSECGHPSQRTNYDHRAAAYVFDRIMGKPTSRSENSITIQLVRQLTDVFVSTFVEVNTLGDPIDRQAAFAERLNELSAQFGGSGA